MTPTLHSPSPPKTISVSQLNQQTKSLLNQAFPQGIWVEGEISNLSRPSSGHLYFTLKDAQAQVKCAFFRGAQSRGALPTSAMKNGQQIQVLAEVSLYAPRGDYQLIVQKAKEAGIGQLQQAYEALKQKLAAEGLFDQSHKQALPSSIHHLVVVTSAQSAAIQDVLSVLARRNPLMAISIVDVPVQGEHAALKIITALANIANHPRLSQADCILLTRGGGSIEDLWCFNDENLAHHIHQHPLPIINAVGHEIDFTIADFAADLRAPTPSAAAEILSHNIDDTALRVKQCQLHLSQLMRRHWQQANTQLQHLAARIKEPSELLNQHAQQLDHLEFRLKQAIDSKLNHAKQRLAMAHSQLQHPSVRVNQQKQALAYLKQRLVQSMEQQKQQTRHRLALACRSLDQLSPLAILSRGYSVAQQNNQVLHSTDQIDPGKSVLVRLHQGQLHCTVERLEHAKPASA